MAKSKKQNLSTSNVKKVVRKQPAKPSSVMKSKKSKEETVAVRSDTSLVYDENFWVKSSHSKETYECERLTDDSVAKIEKLLGYKLPVSYINLMKTKNGGTPKKCNFPLSKGKKKGSDSFVVVEGLYGISKSKNCSLGGTEGSKFWIREWKYPKIGVYFADTDSGGHDMLCLDYSKNGPQGEPQVAHVLQDIPKYHVRIIAETFEDFIRGLVSDKAVK
jgi:hypothetical protein